jgi:hypothetical protein
MLITFNFNSVKKSAKWAALFLVCSFLIAKPSYAQFSGTRDIFGLEFLREIINLNSNDPRVIAANVINILLGFLGLLAVLIILLGGFKWMTAGGNDDRVSEAKRSLGQGLIGLLIIMASFSLANFILDMIARAVEGSI